MSSEKVSLRLNVRRSILVNGFMVRVVPLIFRLSVLEDSAGSGVKLVHCVQHVFIMRLLLVAKL